MVSAEPDVYLVATLFGGLPTCVFPPKTYNRKITSVLVTNSVPSSVEGFRGVIGGAPILQTPVGQNNTLTGYINLPAGQALYIQWSVAGANVSDATARVSFVRDDNPLEGTAGEQSWSNELVTSITVPSTAGPNDPAIVLESSVPQRVIDLVHSKFGLTYQTVAIEMYRRQSNQYWFDALVVDTTPGGDTLIVRGFIGPADNISQYWLYNILTNQTSLQLGTGDFDSSVIIGAGAGSRINVLQNPQNRLTVDINNSERFRVRSTGVLVTGGIDAGTGFDNFTLNGVDQGRGDVLYAASTANAAISNVNGDFLIVNSFTFKAGRAYHVSIGGRYSTSASTNVFLLALWAATPGVDILVFGGFGPQNGTIPMNLYGEGIVARNAGADLTTLLSVHGNTNTGTASWIGATNAPRYLRIRDIGLAANYPSAAPV